MSKRIMVTRKVGTRNTFYKEEYNPFARCLCCGIFLDIDETAVFVHCDNGGVYAESQGVCEDCFWKLIKLYKVSKRKFHRGKGYG